MRKTKNIRIFDVIMIIIAILWLIPVFWMINTAIKPTPDIFTTPPTWIPEHFTLEHIKAVVQNWPFIKWLLNSILVSGISTLISLFLAILAAYSFARITWKGRDTIFVILLASMLIPWQINAVPLYFLMNNLNLLNKLISVILPITAMPISVFLLRQFFVGIPSELEDAARIDGCNRVNTLFRIIIPVSGPALAALAIYMFIFSWNEYFWSLITLQRVEKYTLPIGLNMLQGAYDIEYGLLMAAAFLASIPVMIVFIILRRHIIEGMSWSGVTK
ncbi:carbohydrate ABC transporter permease [Petrotoga sp. 9PWA.NaAc.5.4]|uniref:carbohydrate ABC transporter permease n=1 Tax=Petrotoga sp. 9PWA.NaAc.5.4 TaxID=1434328 RepID=UPI000CB2B48C|nr:carbohydrate ABC transporter permease [Petrotoga sp. 9PWA.NaAc.5.4]PNR95783.1 lactose ABC transporter permease [Petrotoga sp. 9PWA.NaAc.5.4]